ncbi:globin domain-containing protein [Streptomyces monticola]|uniref:nitric oxide dioxygenase n=1 Tax=Streptomyces monticola TaxID=2666263 RepID=A0ABW2JJG3_9ACTN
MDAPTTTSADNGTSGDDGGGGWFTPRKKQAHPAEQSEPGNTGAVREERIPEARRPEEPMREDRSPWGRQDSRPPQDARQDGRPPQSHPSGPHEPSQSRTHEPSQSRPHEPSQSRQSEHATVPPETVPVGAAAVAGGTGAPRTATAGYGAAAEPVGPRDETAQPTPAPEAAGAAEAAGATEAADTHGTGGATVTQAASPDAVLIQRTMAEVGPVADKVTSYFYALLFVRHPDLRMLFPASMDTQRDRLLRALLTAAENIDNTEVLVGYLKNLGRGHRKYGTQPEHYPAVGEALIGSLSRYASSIWNEETEAAWVRAYTTISQIMIDASAEDELRAPAWWFGEVVSHDLRTPDIAVITVRPDQPYPFLAGQYTSLETPWWPRVWRHYSFASAPRPDGLLTFHVKAVPAGWVSNALVHRARPGDTIRLGPPAGSMIVDHGTDNGMLCLGGGTGIAPIKALVEDVAEHGERRPVEVFYGARTDHDLYDIDTMLRLQQSHPWLSVRPVIDTLDQQGQLPDAVREYGPWNEYDAYLSGPPGMIRSGLHALRDAGIPSDRIRHDSLEELVAAAD